MIDVISNTMSRLWPISPCPSITCRLFVVGCARSGTTLLQSLFAAHPEVFSFPESHFFRHLTPSKKWLRRLGFASRGIREHLDDFYDVIGCEDDVTCATPGPITLRMSRYTRAFVSTIDSRAIQSGASYWLEKTPIHLHYISIIERYVPDTQFIHLVRDGRSVVASMHKVTHEHPEIWDGKRTIAECLSHWTSDIERTRRHSEKPSHHVVRYRDLATDPDGTLRALCLALGMDYTSSMIQDRKSKADEVTLGFEEWKERNKQEIIYKGHEKFNRLFDQEQKTQIEKVVDKYNLDELSTI